MKLQNQTAVKIELQYGPAAIDAYLESEAAAYRLGEVGETPWPDHVTIDAAR